jgi:D-glycero-alpha-D-manno-heptose-7-phosphate kinase
MLIRAKAPLRISFAGGGTDIPPYPQTEGGCVICATINKYAYGSLRPTENDQITIKSLDFDTFLNYKIDEELIYDGKLDLIKAAIIKFGGNKSKGFDLFLHSDAPPGSGLGSSSAMMVILVGLLKEYKKIPFTDYEIANLAYIIERKNLGIKGGMQDQYAATFGGFNYIEFLKDRVIVNPLRISQDVINELEHNLILCYMGKTRVSDNIIDDQIGRYEKGEDECLVGMRRLKEITVEMKNALLQRQLNRFGELLYEAWENKKKMSGKISNFQIDKMYEAAIKNGAIGGKVTGAGGGGYMLFYCPFEKKHQVAKVLKEMGGVITEFGFEFNGLQTWRINEN